MKPDIFLMLSTLASASFADGLTHENDLYSQTLTTSQAGQFSYHVDTKTQLCFAHSGRSQQNAMAQIPCASLAKRKEWKEIITWQHQTKDKMQASYRPHR